MNKITKKKIIKLIDGKCRYNSVKNVVELYGAKITEQDYKDILKLIQIIQRIHLRNSFL